MKNTRNRYMQEDRAFFPALYAQDGVPTSKKLVYAVYQIPFKNWTWYLTEYDPKEDLAFGLVDGFEREWGYFTLSELAENGAVFIEAYYPLTMGEFDEKEIRLQLFMETYLEYLNREYGSEETVDDLLLELNEDPMGLTNLGLAYTEIEDELDGHIDAIQTVVDVYRLEYRGLFNDEVVETIKFNSLEELGEFVKSYDFETGVHDVYDIALNGKDGRII